MGRGRQTIKHAVRTIRSLTLLKPCNHLHAKLARALHSGQQSCTVANIDVQNHDVHQRFRRLSIQDLSCTRRLGRARPSMPRRGWSLSPSLQVQWLHNFLLGRGIALHQIELFRCTRWWNWSYSVTSSASRSYRQLRVDGTRSNAKSTEPCLYRHTT